MYGFPSEETVKNLREQYPEGTRVALVNMDDPYSKLQPGDRGTVRNVDDGGTIHVRWDCGSGLGIAYGEDSCRKLTEKELAEEAATQDNTQDTTLDTTQDNTYDDVEKPSKINVLVVEPHKEPYMKEIDSGLSSLQSEVGGMIQAVYPYEDLVGIVCNEEGKINGLELNRAIADEEGNVMDIIAGTFLVTGLTDDEFGSLSPELADKFSKMFRSPESFMMYNGQIHVIKDKPSVREQINKHSAEIKKESKDKQTHKQEHEK